MVCKKWFVDKKYKPTTPGKILKYDYYNDSNFSLDNTRKSERSKLDSHRLHRLLKKSLKKQLRSDVKNGFLLSGGMGLVY